MLFDNLQSSSSMRQSRNTSFQVGPDYLDQFLGGICFGARSLFRALGEKMDPDMIFDDLGHQSRDGAANASDQVHDFIRTVLIFHGPLNGVDETPNAAHAPKQFALFPDRMRHDTIIGYGLTYLSFARYAPASV